MVHLRWRGRQECCMFGLGEPEHPAAASRAPLSPMKEEGLSSQLSAIRNWMQPTVIDQGGGR